MRLLSNKNLDVIDATLIIFSQICPFKEYVNERSDGNTKKYLTNPSKKH